MLINCVAYQNGKKLGDIPADDISDYLTRPDCFVWVALFEKPHRGGAVDHVAGHHDKRNTLRLQGRTHGA